MALLDSARRRRIRRPSTRGDSLAPGRLFIQIIVLQTLYYLTAAVFILFTCLVAGTKFTPDLVFSWRSLQIDNTVGWTVCLVWFLSAVFDVLYLTMIVGRSKLVFDFVLTIHGISLVVTTVYTKHFPVSLLWWLLQIASILAMVFLGTWASRWRELSVMYFPSIITSNSAASSRGLSLVTDSQAEEFELVEHSEAEQPLQTAQV
ncbi:integral membrane protein S linking to the trans Golgi network-domain-containing protein [Lipomyces arxii]|uniref:integral membrane protein S linking to the trans Golgi network-domain-containing protein n=1 Tax=Lipomyces arxii TaxID=56418 RepID=UPI0034CF6C05